MSKHSVLVVESRVFPPHHLNIFIA